MLARANRITDQRDFRLVARSGSRAAGPALVVQCRRVGQADPARFGFVVARSVGTAVVRNRVKRRLRAIAHLEIVKGLGGMEIVVRALPAASHVSWSSLHSEFSAALVRQTGAS